MPRLSFEPHTKASHLAEQRTSNRGSGRTAANRWQVWKQWKTVCLDVRSTVLMVFSKYPEHLHLTLMAGLCPLWYHLSWGGRSACKEHFLRAFALLTKFQRCPRLPGSGGSWENFPHADVVIWNHSSGVSGLSSLPPCPSPPLNCVPCLRQMGVICLCELPITRRARDTYHSKWGCHPPTPHPLTHNASSILPPLPVASTAVAACSCRLSPWFIRN